jgi:hypothetical protein
MKSGEATHRIVALLIGFGLAGDEFADDMILTLCFGD